jgi:hypothetical protein
MIMKKLLALAIGFFLSGLLIASVNAGPNDESGTQLKDETTATTENDKLSKRNRAKLEQAEQAKIRHDKILSSATDTVTK